MTMLSELDRLDDWNDPAPQRRSIIAPVCVILIFGIILSATLPSISWAGFQSLTGFSSKRSVEEDAGKRIFLDDPSFTALFEATQDETIPPAATGEEAIKMNAALPFAAVPIIAAKPFFGTSADASVQDRALTCMTQAVYYEAGFEPEAGKRAVAQVVLNRMRHPAFPKSVCGVVYDGSHKRVCQFSFTCDGSLFRAPAPAAWAAAQAVARASLSGYIEPSVGYATHYHANYVSPYWAPKLTKLAQLGAHIFYRWPGGWGTPSAFNGRYAGLETIPTPRPVLPKIEIINGEEVLVAAPLGPDASDATLELAKKTLPANLVPVRHAENDVGGRVDVSKGWTLKIPVPSESQGAMAAIASKQTGGTEPAAALPAAGSQP
jgi:spore germination cell wall hydrolase CwlJ-like protein